MACAPNQKALQSPSGTDPRLDESSAKKIFFISDEFIIAHAQGAALICDDESDKAQIKNKFSALKNNFFLDKKKLI